MRFWDSSALVILIAGQTGAVTLEALFLEDPAVVIWWGTQIEMVSGVCRLHRESVIDSKELAGHLAAIANLCANADEIQPGEAIRQTAIRLLRVHNLKAADAMQLATALVSTKHSPAGAEFVCLDKRLREAAEKEGFTVLPN